MKKLTKLFALALAITGLVSCGDSATKTSASLVDNNQSKIDLDVHRGGAAQEKEFESMARFSLSALSAEQLEGLDIIQMSSSADEANADAAEVMAQRQMFMAAEKEAQTLEVKFSMSDEPVDNGVFVFAVETETEKELTLEMYDEEGFEMAANNAFQVNSGNNYKALNVKSLKDGAYIFRLKDAEGKELSRTVEIQNEEK